MFKSLKKINLIFKEIIDLITQLENIEVQINEVATLFETNKNNLGSDLSTYIKNTNLKLKDFQALNNNKIYNSSDLAIDFSSTNLVSKNQNFEIDTAKQIMTSVIDTQDIIEPISSVFSNDGLVLTVTFEEPVYFNKLAFSFCDTNKNIITPDKIIFNDFENGTELYESWMKKVKKELLNESLINEFFFNLKKIKTIYFKFNSPVDVSNYNIGFTRNHYKTDSEIVFKIPFGSLKRFVMQKNDFVDYIPVNYQYSLDNSIFYELKFNNTTAVALFENASKEGLFIKATRGALADEHKIKTTEVTTELISLTETMTSKIAYALNYNLDKANDFYLAIDNDLYTALKPLGIVELTVDELTVIPKTFFKKITSLDELKTVKLKNQNSFDGFTTENLPAFYYDNSSLYLPSCFTGLDLVLCYKIDTIVEEVGESDFTPIVFGYNFNLD